MSEDIIPMLKENVIQGRKTKDDEGIDEELSGTPGVEELTRSALENNIPVKEIITKGLTPGMEVVGEKFNAKEFYIPDMLASAEAVSAGMDILKPLFEASNIETKGRVTMATVRKDIHDIGKSIVATLLRGAGYEVEDLGIDVPTKKIVQYVKEKRPDYLGLSALLTSTMVYMGEIIDALKEAGLRDKVKVIVGGAAVSEEYAREIGADAYCVDGFDAIRTLDGFRKAK